MTEGAIWNAPFYIAGLITLLLMLFWPLGTDKETPVKPSRDQDRG